MLILLVPFNVEIEQIEASFLREGSLPDVWEFGASALLNKIAEFDTGISGSMTRLSSFVKQLVQLLTYKSMKWGQKVS